MAIEKGNSLAMYNYGFLLEHGIGIPVDMKEAKRYYKMAAEKGNLFALNAYNKLKFDI